MENKPLIYLIVNAINNKVYVGQTTRTLKKRWYAHKYDCERGVDNHLYRAMRKHDIKNFSIVPFISVLDKEYLNTLEIATVTYYNSFHNGYNSTSGGKALVQFSKVSRAKMSKFQKGKKVSSLTKGLISKGMMGNKNRLGHKHTEESKALMSKALLGKKPNAEGRRRMSIAQKGKVVSPAARKLISLHNYNSRGKVITPSGIFHSTYQASEALGVSSQAITDRCNNKRSRWDSWYFEKPPVKSKK